MMLEWTVLLVVAGLVWGATLLGLCFLMAWLLRFAVQVIVESRQLLIFRRRLRHEASHVATDDDWYEQRRPTSKRTVREPLEVIAERTAVDGRAGAHFTARSSAIAGGLAALSPSLDDEEGDEGGAE